MEELIIKVALMPLSERLKFQNRMAKRAFRHGKNWRQIFVDCGGMCVECYCWNSSLLEFHEPFGEDKFGWGMFQVRVLLCDYCHDVEHKGVFLENRHGKASRLREDVDCEIQMEGGYDNWIKNHVLIDRFGWILCQ